MAAVEYSLFRAKFIKSSQERLGFDPVPSSAELFRASIEERPAAELRKGQMWRIGNLEYFSDETGYFAVGRTTESTFEKYDEGSHEFVEEELTTSPYTHCVFDIRIGLLGIAKKTSLARTPRAMSRRLEELLSHSKVVQQYEITVEILPIPDPGGFLRALLSAHRVTHYTATFRGPNPLDADEYFQKPLSAIAGLTRGQKGKTHISGVDLDAQVLADITRSTAATGNEASARIRKTKNQKPITIHLSGDAVKRTYDEATHRPQDAINDLTDMYKRVKDHEADQR
jgi:hypothetical protein